MVWYNAGSGDTAQKLDTIIELVTDSNETLTEIANILTEQGSAQFTKTITIEALADNTSTPKTIVPFALNTALTWVLSAVGYMGTITHLQVDSNGDVEIIATNNTGLVLPSTVVVITATKS